MRGMREMREMTVIRHVQTFAFVLALPGLALGCTDAGGGEGDDASDETAGDDETADGDTVGDESGDDGPDSTDDTASDTSDTTGDPGPAGVFIGVGDGGRRASSSDASTWDELVGTGTFDTQAESGEEDILRAIAVGDGVAIAVGGGGSDWNGNAMIMRTTDGVGWDEDLVGGDEVLDARKLTAIGYADGVFVAAGYQGHILRSADGGLTWTASVDQHLDRSHAFGVAGHGQTFVVVGGHQDAWDAPLVSFVQRSDDGGQSFAAPNTFGSDGDNLTAVAASDGVFVATGPNVCLRSEDGDAWDDCGLDGAEFGRVSFTNDRFVVPYLDGVSTSIDGADWSPHVVSPTGVPPKVVFGNGLYAGIRYYDRGTSQALDAWTFSAHPSFPLRDLAFLALE